jgi:hypothetical protein
MNTMLSDILAAVKPVPKEGEKDKVKRKYVQFSLEEWQAMEANAGQTLATQDVKSIIQGVFAGKLALSVAGK